MILIGSRALKHFDPTVQCDESDWDILATNKEIERMSEAADQVKRGSHSDQLTFGGHRFELTPIEFLDSQNLDCFLSVETQQLPATGMSAIVMGLPGLALIKRSHLHRPLKWGKHIRDYHRMRKMIWTPTQRYRELLKERTTLTKLEFRDRTPSLKMSNDDFFEDNVRKFYVHDDIHAATCYYDRPLYERLKLDEEKDNAWCVKDLWNELSDDDKMRCVREEGFVIALERKIIPMREQGKNYPAKMAFHYAVERICTTLCGGYFRDFAIDNWPQITDFEWDFPDFIGKFTHAKLERL